jgi:hypothetical protein
MKKTEAVLESLAIPNLCLKGQSFIAQRQLEFQFNDLTDRNIAGNYGAKAAFAQILAAAMQ